MHPTPGPATPMANSDLGVPWGSAWAALSSFDLRQVPGDPRHKLCCSVNVWGPWARGWQLRGQKRRASPCGRGQSIPVHWDRHAHPPHLQMAKTDASPAWRCSGPPGPLPSGTSRAPAVAIHAGSSQHGLQVASFGVTVSLHKAKGINPSLPVGAWTQGLRALLKMAGHGVRCTLGAAAGDVAG